MIYQHELKAEDVRAYAFKTSKKHLRIDANGYCCQTGMLYDVLMKASAECSSLEAECTDLENVADSNTLHEYVNKALPGKELFAQEERANLALAECIPESMARQGIEIAIVIWRQVRLTLAPLRFAGRRSVGSARNPAPAAKKPGVYGQRFCFNATCLTTEAKQSAIIANPIRGKTGGASALCHRRSS